MEAFHCWGRTWVLESSADDAASVILTLSRDTVWEKDGTYRLCDLPRGLRVGIRQPACRNDTVLRWRRKGSGGAAWILWVGFGTCIRREPGR